jgi:hypothetical protein
LADLFIDIAGDLARDQKHCVPYLGALGHLRVIAPLASRKTKIS